jgi:hypothetical protein
MPEDATEYQEIIVVGHLHDTCQYTQQEPQAQHGSVVVEERTGQQLAATFHRRLFHIYSILLQRYK